MGGNISYKDSGVDIDKGNRFVDVIKPLVKTTFRKEVMGSLGGFGGLFHPELQAHLDRAVLLVKCIQQRNVTLVRLVRRLVVLQRAFILHGDQHLMPITRARLASELEVHESTVSRAVSEKAIQMPNGRLLPVSKLFDRSLNVRTILRQIIEQENEPLNDNQLVDLLNEQGFCVARRTVAKYRSIEGILPARMRQPAPKPTMQSLQSQ